MKDEKREPRSYKAKQTPYVKACKRAKKESTTLAERIEEWVVDYAYGYSVDVNAEVKYLAKRIASQKIRIKHDLDR
jgi:hypothetical protein